MPWKVKNTMEIRAEFVRRLRAGERMTDLCEEFGISRKTGYKVEQRFEAQGELGLRDQSRAPKRSPQQMPKEVAELLVLARQKNPGWGGRKLKAVLTKRHPGLTFPASSTIDALLKRRGLVQPRKYRGGLVRYEDALQVAHAPNVVWCTDYKGQFRTGDGKYCYPLTVTDRFSRFFLGCDGFERIDTEAAMAAYQAIFAEFGLPSIMRSDNGAPFASKSLWGMSRLSVWWMRLGIWPERIEPGHPQQNGQHERMHLDLKRDTTRPAQKNLLAQQERFDAFRAEYNEVRPHEALAMKTPSDVYLPSLRRPPAKLAPPVYPLHDDVIEVARTGHVRIGRKSFFIAAPLAGELLGIREITPNHWVISFLQHDLGTWDASGGFKPWPMPQSPAI